MNVIAKGCLKYFYAPGDFFNPDTVSHQVYSCLPFDDSNVAILSLQGIYTTTLESIPAASFVSHYWSRFPYQMRGNHLNDLYISGQSSLVAHYNGLSIIDYPIPGDFNFSGLSILNEHVVIAGSKNGVSVVIRNK